MSVVNFFHIFYLNKNSLVSLKIGQLMYKGILKVIEKTCKTSCDYTTHWFNIFIRNMRLN